VPPQRWQQADAAGIGKNNGKKGCRAVRYISILDPGGKVFFSTVWDKAKCKRRYFA
jgi:hypothetical protein